jgi:trans-2,3-dihydro-3-hydroxyanthranilate isomerase
MRADVVWWDLDETSLDVEALAARLRDDGVQEWADVPGLVVKLWLADRRHNRWGALMLWDPERPDEAFLPPNRAAELIGAPPSQRTRFDVEAMVGINA